MHHAYLLVGQREGALRYLDSLLTGLEFKKENNPDWVSFSEETFGIDEARALASLVSRRSFESKKIFWISPEYLTLEAQNALLKTFEEPTRDTHIFLHTRDRELLLPTLVSRLRVVEVVSSEGSERAESLASQGDFLELSLLERLEFAKTFGKKGESLAIFLDGLMSALRGEVGKRPGALARVYALRKYADGRSVSERAILEHLSFVV